MEILTQVFLVIISAVLGHYLSDILSLIRFLSKKGSFHHLHGEWFEYRFSSRKDEATFHESKAQFHTKGLRTGSITITPLSKGNPSYKGRLYFKRGHNSTKAKKLHIECKCTSTQETFTVIIDNVIQNQDGLMYGLEIGVDCDNRTHASICLYSKKKLKRDEATKLINFRMFTKVVATLRI